MVDDMAAPDGLRTGGRARSFGGVRTLVMAARTLTIVPPRTGLAEMDGAALYPLAKDEYGVCFVVEDLPLLAGQYSLDLCLMDANNLHVYDCWKGVAPFKVRHDRTKEDGLARLPCHWERP